MRHVLIATFAATALIAGCDHHDKSGATSAQPAAAKSAETAKPANAAKPAGAAVSAPKVYPKEITRKGEVYVFASDDAVAQFIATKTPPANMKTVPGAGPNGETVHFETGTPADDALVAEYQKLHPAKK